MQRCFDVAVDVKRDENHLKLATFLNASRYDRQKSNTLHELDIGQGHTRNCWWNSRGYEHKFVSIGLYLEATMNAMEGACAIYLTFEQKHPRVDKGAKFFKIQI